ncbi:MAG: hypothetical protein HONBIEJF_01029 [Fimbriimonadaceae bacterium]|nr:hypothetical protein [Fimbriimonadaceae bacterium]
MAWSYALATARGQIHGENDPCQDRVLCRQDPETGRIVAVVADGAGSARLGGLGAEVACRTFVDMLLAWPEPSVGEEQARRLVTAIGERVRQVAEESVADVAELSSTLVGVCLGGGLSVAIQVGDGATVYANGDGFDVAMWPLQSEFVNETTFLTSPQAPERVQVRPFEHEPDSVFLFSDGLQYLLLDFSNKVVHAPFFAAVQARMIDQEPGESAAINRWLEATLSSPAVTSRSDDDTSLIVLQRKATP